MKRNKANGKYNSENALEIIHSDEEKKTWIVHSFVHSFSTFEPLRVVAAPLSSTFLIFYSSRSLYGNVTAAPDIQKTWNWFECHTSHRMQYGKQ